VRPYGVRSSYGVVPDYGVQPNYGIQPTYGVYSDTEALYALLLEDGFSLLLESGGRIMLEDNTVVLGGGMGSLMMAGSVNTAVGGRRVRIVGETVEDDVVSLTRWQRLKAWGARMIEKVRNVFKRAA